jgi:hypothetical protein
MTSSVKVIANLVTSELSSFLFLQTFTIVTYIYISYGSVTGYQFDKFLSIFQVSLLSMPLSRLELLGYNAM